MRQLLVIPLSLLILLVAAMIWSGAAGHGDRADFTFVNRGDNKTLDLNNMSWMQDIRIAYALWEGLYALDPITLKPVPGCADRIDIDPTGCIYTFHIRDTAKWSNGDPVTADDFLFEWRRMLESPGEYSYLYYYIQGAQEYSQAFTSDKPPKDLSFANVGIARLDGQTLRVILKHPVSFFPALCAFPPFFPLHEKSIEPYKSVDPATGRVSYDPQFTRHLVSNGPYRMFDWQFKRRIRMVASEYYWNRPTVKTRVIDQVYAEDPMAAVRLYESGAVDWLADVDADIAAEMLASGRRDLHVFPAFGTYYYTFNCQKQVTDAGGTRIANPLLDRRVRQALAMAIDKMPIVQNVGKLDQPITTDYVPPHTFADYASPAGLPYDVAQARQLLADAGYPGGKGFPRLTILVNNEGPHRDVAQIIRRQWHEGLGIDVDMESVEVKVFGARLHSQQYAIARTSWFGDYDDPSTFTDKYRSDSEGNDPKWVNPQYDQLCRQAENEPDAKKRMKLLSQAEDILLTDAAIVPIYTYVNTYLFRDNVTGIPLSANAMLMFQAIGVKR